MVLTGGYAWFERLALVLSLALFSFVVLAVAGRPDLGHLVSDLSPVPRDVPHDYFALVVAMVGASIMPWMLFYQQSASVDKKLTREDLRGSRVETLVGAFASQALMAAIVIAAAAAMSSAAAGPRAADEPGRAARGTGPSRQRRRRLAHRHRAHRLRAARSRGGIALGRLGSRRADGLAAQPQPQAERGSPLLRRLLRRGRSGGGHRPALAATWCGSASGRWSSTSSCWHCRWPSWSASRAIASLLGDLANSRFRHRSCGSSPSPCWPAASFGLIQYLT